MVKLFVGEFGWETWASTPGWVAFMFLLALLVLWIWDLLRIIQAVKRLNWVRKQDSKLVKGSIAALRFAIDKATGVADFLEKHAEMNGDDDKKSGEEEGGNWFKRRLKQGKGGAETAKVGAVRALLWLGRKPAEKVVEKVEEKVEEKMDKLQVSLMLGGFIIQVMPLIVLVMLRLLDFYYG